MPRHSCRRRAVARHVLDRHRLLSTRAPAAARGVRARARRAGRAAAAYGMPLSAKSFAYTLVAVKPGNRVQLVDDDLARRDARRSRRGPSPRSRWRRTPRRRARRTSLGRLVRKSRGDDQIHPTIGVLRVEVVPVGVRHDLADDRGDRLAVAEHTDLDLDARLELLDEHLVVVPAGERDGRLELLAVSWPSRSRPKIRAVQA